MICENYETLSKIMENKKNDLSLKLLHGFHDSTGHWCA